MPQIVVVRTVNLPVDLVGACTVHRSVAAQRITGEAGSHPDHLREVAAVERDVLNRFAGEDGCLCRRGRVEREAGGVHFDRCRLRSDCKLQRNGVNRSRGNGNLLDL